MAKAPGILPRASNLFLAIVLVAGITITPLLTGGKAYAEASTNTQSFTIPVDFTYTTAKSGCSEDIHLSGTLHVVTHTTINSNGGSIVKEQYNPQGITGTGLTTGIKFQGTGVTNTVSTFNGANAKTTDTFVVNFNLIGHGSVSNSDSIHHLNTQVTVNANGKVTAVVFNEISTCR